VEPTGIVRKVGVSGHVVIPFKLRHMLDIKEKDLIEIFIRGNQIILQKYTPYHNPPCVVTGEVTSQNKEYANGITLSPLGARILLYEIRKKYQLKD
jgi:AbrB family transcriptional regulator, transcriptional pleiotropic regulator of transition state genes